MEKVEVVLLRKKRTWGICLTIFLFVFSAAVSFGNSNEEMERRLEEMEKRIEDSVKSGQSPTPQMIEEIAKILEELENIEKGEKEKDKDKKYEDSSGDGWMEVPFTGTITVSRILSGSAVMTEENGSRNGSGSGKKDWRWSGKKESDGSSPEVSGGSSSWSGSSSAFLSAMITGAEEIRDGEGNVIGYQPVGYVTGRVTERERFRAKHVSIKSLYSYSAREEHTVSPEGIDGWCRLTVNPNEGRYELSFPSIYLGDGTGETVMVFSAPDLRLEKREPWNGLGPVDWVPSAPDRETLLYSPESGVIQGSFSYSMPPGGIDVELLRKGLGSFPPELSGLKGELLSDYSKIAENLADAAGKIPGMYSGKWTVAWSLTIGSVPVKVELEPMGDYENWMPELIWGMGNFVRVRAKIVEPAGLTGKIRFTLKDVSREPGVCMNYPFHDREEAPDLVISEMSGSGLNITEDGQSAVTLDDVNEAEVVLQSRDFGARGKLSATATVLAGGKEIEVRAVLKRTGEHDVTLPLDENSNGIADYWEKAHNIYPCAGDCDDDGEPEGKAPGDGLSAWEEYRGFFVRGKHERLDPNRKDLFVYDPDGLAEKAGFGSVTRLAVHYVEPEEGRCTGTNDRARVVNFRAGSSHLVDQHCLWIKKDALPEPDPFNWGCCEGGREIGPPRTADRYVLVYADQIRADLERTVQENRPEITNALGQRGLRPDAAWLEGQINAAVAMTTIHEACHGLGISHHYTSLLQTLPKGADVERAVMELDISPSTGQMSCVMRYTRDWGKHPRLTFKAESETLDMLRGRPWPNTLCETLDDCRGQMVISDREQGRIY